MGEKKMEIAEELLMEFQEVQNMVDNEEETPYSTWTKFCTSFYTILCC